MSMKLDLVNKTLEQHGFAPMSIEAFRAAEDYDIRRTPSPSNRADYAAKRAMTAAPTSQSVMQEAAIGFAIVKQGKKHVKLYIEMLESAGGRHSEELREAIRYAKMSLMYLNVHLQDNE